MTEESNAISTKDLGSRKVWFHRPKKKDPDAVKKLGRIRAWVFHPTEPRCVGMLVKRPDLAWMFRRSDSFVAFNGFELLGKNVLIKEDASAKDKGACKALGIRLDDCVIWSGMDVITEDGNNIGVVDDVLFDKDTGEIISITISQGATANTLLGKRRIPLGMIKGFKRGIGRKLNDNYGDSAETDEELRGAVLVSADAAKQDLEGGAAETAGTAAAVATVKTKAVIRKAKPKVKQAGKVAGEAVEKGVYAAGRQIGRSKGMFGSFVDEFKAAMNDDDE